VLAANQKADALLAASHADDLCDQARRYFGRAVARARTDIERARAKIAEAQAAADNA
jgi:hypothetical protein